MTQTDSEQIIRFVLGKARTVDIYICMIFKCSFISFATVSVFKCFKFF